SSGADGPALLFDADAPFVPDLLVCTPPHTVGVAPEIVATPVERPLAKGGFFLFDPSVDRPDFLPFHLYHPLLSAGIRRGLLPPLSGTLRRGVAGLDGLPHVVAGVLPLSRMGSPQ